MIAGSMRLLSDIQGLTFSRCCCFASNSPRYRSSSLVRRFSSLRNLYTSPFPAAIHQLRAFPSSCPRQPGTPVFGHSFQPCCGFSSGGPQARRRSAYAPTTRPHWRAAASPRPSLHAGQPSRQPLPARHASRPGYDSAAAPHRPRSRNLVRSGPATGALRGARHGASSHPSAAGPVAPCG